MDIGTGIFLSSLCLSTVGLFVATKDRWNWKKIFIFPLVIVAGLSAIGFAISYLYKQYESRPLKVMEFKGIKLGEKLQDVIFKHGLAKREEAEDAEKLAKYIVDYASEKGTPKFEEVARAYKKAKEAEAASIAMGLDGNYFFGDVRVGIKNNQIEDIAYLCSTGSASLNGIGCGSNGDEILKKFEGKVKILCRKKNEEGGANLERLYKVAKYGTNYYLNTNVVVAIMIAEPKTIDSFVGKNWDKCN